MYWLKYICLYIKQRKEKKWRKQSEKGSNLIFTYLYGRLTM